MAPEPEHSRSTIESEVINLTQPERTELVRQIQQHFEDEFELELGDLRAGFVLEFFSKLLGAALYNRALADARAIVADRAQTIDEELFGLTRDTPRRDGPSTADTGQQEP